MIGPRIESLILKYLSKSATAEELDILSDWILVEGNERTFEEYIQLHLEITTAMNEPDIGKIKKNILQKIKKDKNRKSYKNIAKYAAIGLVMFGSGYLFQQLYFGQMGTDVLIPKEEPITITLDNGRVEILEPTEKKIVRDALGNVLGTQDKSKLVYSEPSSNKKIVYNTLNVPYGKQFDVVLSDGTRVFLNAGTSLRYPIAFVEGNNRKVFLTGEAYFEVAKDAERPFIVNTSDIEIGVLGTKFNVSHYPEDSNINTVLVEGSVELSRTKEDSKTEPLLLEPGYKGEWDRSSNEIVVKSVDTSLYTAWVQGKLVFRNTSFRQIRQTLERHYNISIKNSNIHLDEQLFDATFDIETIGEVLESFNRSYAIEYAIVDNAVLIK